MVPYNRETWGKLSVSKIAVVGKLAPNKSGKRKWNKDKLECCHHVQKSGHPSWFSTKVKKERRKNDDATEEWGKGVGGGKFGADPTESGLTTKKKARE